MVCIVVIYIDGLLASNAVLSDTSCAPLYRCDSSDRVWCQTGEKWQNDETGRETHGQIGTLARIRHKVWDLSPSSVYCRRATPIACPGCSCSCSSSRSLKVWCTMEWATPSWPSALPSVLCYPCRLVYHPAGRACPISSCLPFPTHSNSNSSGTGLSCLLACS